MGPILIPIPVLISSPKGTSVIAIERKPLETGTTTPQNSNRVTVNWMRDQSQTKMASAFLELIVPRSVHLEGHDDQAVRSRPAWWPRPDGGVQANPLNITVDS